MTTTNNNSTPEIPEKPKPGAGQTVLAFLFLGGIIYMIYLSVKLYLH